MKWRPEEVLERKAMPTKNSIFDKKKLRNERRKKRHSMMKKVREFVAKTPTFEGWLK